MALLDAHRVVLPISRACSFVRNLSSLLVSELRDELVEGRVELVIHGVELAPCDPQVLLERCVELRVLFVVLCVGG